VFEYLLGHSSTYNEHQSGSKRGVKEVYVCEIHLPQTPFGCHPVSEQHGMKLFLTAMVKSPNQKIKGKMLVITVFVLRDSL